MCKFTMPIAKVKTVEELVSEKSVGMTDEQKAQYWYELSQSIFSLLGKVDVPIYEIGTDVWYQIARAQYQTLVNVELADTKYYTTAEAALAEILKKDWSNLVPFVPEKGDCDKFGIRLYNHLVDYYGLTGIVPVWGMTDKGYHGFNLAVLRQDGAWVARLVEPQTDAIFVDVGPCGRYKPDKITEEMGVLKVDVGGGGGGDVSR